MAELKNVSLIEARLHQEKYEIMFCCTECGHELKIGVYGDCGECENCGEFVLRKDFDYAIFER